MGSGYLSVEKKSSADAVIRKDSFQDAPQVMRSRMTKEQQEGQMQKIVPVQKGALKEAGEEIPQTAENNIMIRLRNAALSVKTDRRVFGDSYRMLLIKESIDRFYELQDRQIEQESDFDSLKVLAVDTYTELIRVCDEYLKARRKEGKSEQAQTGRYKKVRLLHDCARTGLRQIASMTAEDFRARFEGDEKGKLLDAEEAGKLRAGEEQRIRFGKLLERDVARRNTETEEAGERMNTEMQLRHERNHAGLYTYQVYFENVSSDRQLAAALESYSRLSGQFLPKNAEGFADGKARLLAVCDQILHQTDNIIRSGAFLKKNKVRREQASRLKEQINWERERLFNTGFNELNADRALTWDKVWEGEQAVIRFSDAAGSGALDSYQQDHVLEMKSSFYEKDGAGELAPEFAGLQDQQASVGNKGTVLMARVLGVEDLFASHKDVTMVNDQRIKGRSTGMWGGNTQKGYISHEKGITLMEALEFAREMQMNLMYSGEAIKQLKTIQIIDMICGQVNRTDDSLRVTVKEGTREGVDYLVITGVMAVKNEYSFGTAGFEDVNKNAEHSSLRQLFNKSKSRISIGAYDPDFADRVMDLNADEVVRIFNANGLSDEQKEALKDRLTGVQEALREDKSNPETMRGRLEKHRVKNHYYDADPPLSKEQKKAIDARSKYDDLYESQFFSGLRRFNYINPALTRDYGNTWDINPEGYRDKHWGLNQANDYVDEDILHSVKVRKARSEAVRALVSEEADNADKIPEGSLHHKIILMMEQYAALEVTTERAARLQNRGVKMTEILDKLQGFQVEEPLKTRLSKMETVHGLPALEGYMVGTMRELIEERLRELNGMQEKDPETYEEKQLKKYLGLIADSKGLLQAPPRVDADENGLTVLDSDSREVEENNTKHAEKEALFPHPPCIQDTVQGQLKNCFWIASLAAVVEKDPGFIQRHMLDEGDTVIVRLYKDRKPFHVRVKKTIHADKNGNPLYAKGALWVQMYEKALVVSGLLVSRVRDKEEWERFQRLERMNKRSYAMGCSKNPLIALPVITGKSTEEIFTESKVNNSRDDIERTRMDRRVMLGDGTLCYNEDFNLSENIRDTAREIKNAQKKGLIITASTRDSFIQNTAKRAGGNEYEERGLYSHHAYTVIGIETKNDIDCVRLRNPWGDGGLLEVRNPLTGVITYIGTRDRYGTFVIDMKTFVTYFSNITTGSI